ncbi:DUF11 domain-containing protein [Streptomyces sp. NBC_00249]|uniref:DUF11 domain-containing protein n=1 Tax=Streptomyces sp. NBC_00249 TaxID=2975690 RepID=UPI00225BEA19|nr:DUF11 domain-containing protein [Streptomyces sp. NBC_00249]MCX5198700.1 DUF11 domain-containing protein [Streptomyces sp. NBC_00249]
MIRGTHGSNHGKRRQRALSALGAVGIVAGLAAGLPAAPAGAVPVRAAAVTQPHPDGNPVACDGKVYVSFGDPDQLYTADRGPGTVQFSALGNPTSFLYNAIGVNPHDRFLYGTTFGDIGNHLVRFDGDGESTDLGPIDGLPPALYISGTFDDKGNYYVLADNTGEIYQIDVASRSVTNVVNVPALADPELDVFDIAFRDGFLWGSTDDGAVTRIDIANEIVAFFPGVLPGGEDFGGVFTYGNGDLGFFRNSGQLIRVHVKNAAGSNPVFTVLSTQTTTPATNLDATSCFLDSSADLAVRKDGPKKVEAGSEITYRITVKNVGKHDSSGWSLIDDLPARLLSPTTPTDGCEITDGLLSCTGGPLAKGESEEIEVTGTAGNVTSPTTVKNTATVFGDDADPHKDNNTDTASTHVKPGDDD